MVEFSNTSILRGVGMDNIESIRRIMNGLMSRLSLLSSEQAACRAKLTNTESTLVDSIYQASQGNRLLDGMIRRFASGRNANPRVIITSARELHSIAIEAVLNPASRPDTELAMAEAQFQRMVDAGQFVYWPESENKGGDIDRDSEIEEGDDEPEVEEEFLEERQENQAVQAGSGDPKRAPVHHEGDCCINDGTHDRNPAKVGWPDDAKLTITYRRQRRHAQLSSVWVSLRSAKYTYRSPVDWSNTQSVRKLNNWRRVNFTKQIGPKTPEEEVWLESERERLYDILEKHATSSVVRGRWSRIDWHAVANIYNTGFQGTLQRAGQLTAKRYHPIGSDRHAISEIQRLKDDREAPKRSGPACRDQFQEFMDARVEIFIRDAKLADQPLGSNSNIYNDQNPRNYWKGKTKADMQTLKKGRQTCKAISDHLSDDEEEFPMRGEALKKKIIKKEESNDDEIANRDTQGALEVSLLSKKRKVRDDDDADPPTSSRAGRPTFSHI